MSNRSVLRAWLVSWAWCAVVAGVDAADWPQQMGPNRDGVIPADVAGDIAVELGRAPAALWQANVGLGTAPPIVVGGNLYTFGLFRPGTGISGLDDPRSTPNQHEIEEGRKATRIQDLPGVGPREVDWTVYRGELYAQCLDAATGRRLWATLLTDWGVSYEENGIIYGGAGASPAAADGRLFLHSPCGRLYALGLADGRKLWEVNLYEHGMTQCTEKQFNEAGPLVVGGVVIVSFVGEGGRLAAAGFDATTGKPAWRYQNDYNSLRPHNSRIGLATIHGEPTALLSCGGGTVGLNPATGKERWTVPALHNSKFAPWPGYAPVAWENFVMDVVDYAHNDRGSHSYGIAIGADQTPRVTWRSEQFKPMAFVLKGNMIARDGKVYGFDADGYRDPEGLREANTPVGDFTDAKNVERKDPDVPKDPIRPWRGDAIKRFQCRDIKTGRLLWSSDAFDRTGERGWDKEDYHELYWIIAGETAIAADRFGVWIGRLRDEGLDLITRIDGGVFLGEPVLVDGRLYVRQVNMGQYGPEPEFHGLAARLGGKGNLTCLDLGPRGMQNAGRLSPPLRH